MVRRILGSLKVWNHRSKRMLELSVVEKAFIFGTFCIGMQGSARRKKKVIHRTNTTDDKKLQVSLKKLGLTTIPGIEEVK